MTKKSVTHLIKEKQLTLANQTRAPKRQKLRNAEYYNLQATFDKLYQNSKHGRKFNNLMEIISTKENILLAFRNIKKNKGSRTAGVDKRTIEDIERTDTEKMVKTVQKKLCQYKPQKVRRVEIPKSDGKTRPLGIPTILDRLIQQCILQVLEPICEARFHERNNGFRPNRSAEHAIAQASRMIQIHGMHYVIDIDIKNFFDNVSHGKLIKQMWTMGICDKKLLKVISVMLKAEVAGVGFPDKGTPQGGIISPLLSNIVLNELDWWISSQWETMPTEFRYKEESIKNGRVIKQNSIRWDALKRSKLKECFIVRYADDFKIFCRTKSVAKKLFAATQDWLNKRLGLEIHPHKSKIVDLKSQYSEFLGFRLKAIKKGKKHNGKDKFICRSHVSEKSKKKILTRAKEIIKEIKHSGSKGKMYKAIMLYNSYVAGVHNYYKIATCVNLDFSEIAYQVNRTMHNRLKNQIKRTGINRNKYIAEKYGKSTGIHYINDMPIIPIWYVQFRIPMMKKNEIQKYTPNGRKEIHQNLSSVNTDILHSLMQNPEEGKSIEYNDNRLAVYSSLKENVL